MYFPTITLFVLAFASLVGAQSHQVDAYIPQLEACPKNLKVRPAKGLSQAEQNWRTKRLRNVISSLETYLEQVDIPDLNVTRFIRQLTAANAPVVGLAISGGGSQSGIGGLGIWRAFDARYPPAVQAGTAGLTQCLSFITGLSGGGALTVSTLASNNFTSIAEVRQAINFTTDYTVGPTGNATEYITEIFENVGAKIEAGFPVSVTDAFGQFWQQYLPESWAFQNYSDIAGPNQAFTMGKAPMPIISLAEVIPGQSPEIGNIMHTGPNATNGFNLTSYEITPFEFGSWLGGRIQAFFPTRWLGTAMRQGRPQSKDCVLGFDKFSFIQGSTATAFNFWFIDEWFGIPLFAKRAEAAVMSLRNRQATSQTINIPEDQVDNPTVQLVNETASNFGQTFNESLWATYPNPFQGYNRAMTGISELLLVDGSETGETIPLRPLIVPQRKVDFIIAYEASSDAEYSWVNGTNLINTAKSSRQGRIPFPRIPDVNTMLNQNLTLQPTFFGCNATLESGVPLVLYLPNSPWSAYTNYSYTKSSFTNEQMDVVLDNAFNLATYGNGTVSKQWPACLACAVVRKSMQRLRMDVPEICKRCFEMHCWNGSVDDREYEPRVGGPRLRLDLGLGYEEWNETVWHGP